jgi:hypothetical protein
LRGRKEGRTDRRGIVGNTPPFLFGWSQVQILAWRPSFQTDVFRSFIGPSWQMR